MSLQTSMRNNYPQQYYNYSGDQGNIVTQSHDHYQIQQQLEGAHHQTHSEFPGTSIATTITTTTSSSSNGDLYYRGGQFDQLTIVETNDNTTDEPQQHQVMDPVVEFSHNHHHHHQYLHNEQQQQASFHNYYEHYNEHYHSHQHHQQQQQQHFQHHTYDQSYNPQPNFQELQQQHQQQLVNESYHCLEVTYTTFPSSHDKIQANGGSGGDDDDDDDNEQSQQSSAASTSSSMGSQMTRDERKAIEANIPLTYTQIVSMSIDQFNEQIAKHGFSEAQLNLMKDIRRRGKNKVAAQTCRKRKMEQINVLQFEVEQLRSQRMALSHERNQLVDEHARLVREYEKVYPLIEPPVNNEVISYLSNKVDCS